MTYEFGPFLYSRTEGLRRGSQSVQLKPSERFLLELFLRRKGEVVGRDELERALWENFGVKRAVATNALNNQIFNLRKVLGDDADIPAFIYTHPGKGYEFIATVREIPTESATEDHRRSPRTGFIVLSATGVTVYEIVAILAEVAQAWDMLGKSAVSHAALYATPVFALTAAALVLDSRLVRRDRPHLGLLVGSLLAILGVVVFWLGALRFLPWEQTVFAVFTTLVAPTGFFKTGVIYGAALVMAFIVLPFHNIAMVDQRMATQRGRVNARVSPSLVFIRPAALFVVAGLTCAISLGLTLLLFVMLRSTPYAWLFSLLALVRWTVWHSIAWGGAIWYATVYAHLTDKLRRDARASVTPKD